MVAHNRERSMLSAVRVVMPTDQNENTDPFADFWLLYPRRVAKKDAQKAWARVPADQHIKILTSLVSWRAIWRDKDPEYLPHPASWLNGERWEDELPHAYVAQHLSHMQAKPIPLGERTQMPEHVRLLLAKLREKK